MNISTIYKSINEDLIKVNDALKSITTVDFPWLSELLDYSLKSSGKKIRPVLTLLSGKFYNYNFDRLRPMATAVEIMHTATLVHDDAIDKSIVRRGIPTVNKLWGEGKAILLGDYLFAEAGSLTADTNNLRVVKLFTKTLRTLSSGELNQSFNAFNLEQTNEQYLQRISNKTASLFSMATESGALLSEAPEEATQHLKEYGHNLGIAFQIVDDILDFIGTEEEMGKPVGSDLAQGTLTLPAMILLKHHPDDNPVKRLFHNENKQDNIRQAIELVRSSSIIKDCYTVASDYCTRAHQCLSLLPDGDNRRALAKLADFVVSRKR